jgi:hypothetical protein
LDYATQVRFIGIRPRPDNDVADNHLNHRPRANRPNFRLDSRRQRRASWSGTSIATPAKIVSQRVV